MGIKKRYRTHNGRLFIDLHLRTINQLFDSRDPSPFLDRDLDDNAVDYIVSATMEQPLRTPISLAIHLSDATGFSVDDKTVVEAFHNHFDYDAELIRKKISRVLRQGQFASLIGVMILFACLSIVQTIGPIPQHSYLTVIREGLLIFGWVAMWRPIDMFLYSWWPLADLRRVSIKLSKVPIEIKLLKK